mgnify:CR=1 FL=1
MDAEGGQHNACTLSTVADINAAEWVICFRAKCSMVMKVCKMGKYEMLDQRHDSLGVLLKFYNNIMYFIWENVK